MEGGTFTLAESQCARKDELASPVDLKLSETNFLLTLVN